MKNLAIKAENISKQYRLGEVGTGTLSHDLNRFWSKLRGKEDPYLKIGDANDRTRKGASDYVWSLKDINFEIEQGDAMGIIGRNGAGKSTLLKLLSKVTKPTTGNFKINGRIASLLEVGTGFNPDMTGRENIYMNGSMLGMRRHEITRKFDEIVDFAGVEKYIDTPAKRYSSGMYVRLAFAVAAHLDSEILIVDEVLAVGDAEFQKKCLGKMGDVTKGEGRTVIFVSHNMAAINTLCNKGLLLQNGKLLLNGNVDEVLKVYQQKVNEDINGQYAGDCYIKKATLVLENNCIVFKSQFQLDVFFEVDFKIKYLVLGIIIKDINDTEILSINNKHYNKPKLHSNDISKGKVSILIEEFKIVPGLYKIDIFLGDTSTDFEVLKEAMIFEVVESKQNKLVYNLDYRSNKVVHDDILWSYNNLDT